jgi:hypothetical protein
VDLSSWDSGISKFVAVVVIVAVDDYGGDNGDDANGDDEEDEDEDVSRSSETRIHRHCAVSYV